MLLCSQLEAPGISSRLRKVSLAPPMYGRSRAARRQGGVTAMLAERERRPTAAMDMSILRWAASSWLDKPIRSSSYCKLNPEAKSTIALAFSTDGVLFASTHGDHTVKVFQCATWSIMCTLRGHRRTPWTIKFHPRDRNILASGSLDETVRIWDLRTETCVRVLEFDFVVSCLAFHSSGELLAVTSGRRIFLCRWGQRSSQPQAVASTTSAGTSVIPTPPQHPPAASNPSALPGILERLAGWAPGGSGGNAASANAAGAHGAVSAGLGGGGGSGGGAAAGSAAAAAFGFGGLLADPPEPPEPPNKVVILSGENPQRCVAFKVRMEPPREAKRRFGAGAGGGRAKRAGAQTTWSPLASPVADVHIFSHNSQPPPPLPLLPRLSPPPCTAPCSHLAAFGHARALLRGRDEP